MFGDCAIALHWVACALDSLQSSLTRYGGRLSESEDRAKPYEDLERLVPEMDALNEQLSKTLAPEHDALVAFGGARAALADIVEAAGLLRDPSSHEVVNVERFVDDTIARVLEQRDRFDACRDQFMAASRDSPGGE